MEIVLFIRYIDFNSFFEFFNSEVSVTVSSDLDSAVIHNLKPYTMYSITMTANNNYGSSLPSDRVRSLTLDSGIGSQTSVAVVPVLPGKLNQTNKIIHIFVCFTIC